MNDKIAASTETSGSHVLELASLGLAAAADAIRSGDMTSESYASALLYQARAHADLNAFIAIDEDALLQAAKDADKARRRSGGSLLGVPCWDQGQLSDGGACYKHRP